VHLPPVENVTQASLVDGIEIIGVTSLKSPFLHLKKEVPLTRFAQPPLITPTATLSGPTLDDVHGQEQAKRALVIAAAGRHNLLLTGSPGAGKTMLARTLAGLLPDLSREEQIAVTKIHSLSGESPSAVLSSRPFRSPHHTASRVALIGGGTKPKPGEISLAHAGVLFLDEIPEYSRSTLESLRQPLEDRVVAISRANGFVTYPADFMLIATMNPCPCGFYSDISRECSCSTVQIMAYQKRLSGPLLDRIDMTVSVSRVPNEALLHESSSHKKQHIDAKKLILKAIETQANRYKSGNKNNSNLSNQEIKRHLALSDEVCQLLFAATERLNLSVRGYFKTIKVARTIADLEDAAIISTSHVSEALQYRQNP
jgi:magnesium chelatase family protein